VTQLPYVLQGTHKNLHRLASLVLCIQSAPKSRVSTASALGALYATRLRQRIPIPEADVARVQAYLAERGLTDRYLPPNQKVTLPLSERLHAGEAIVEIQDWFLSDPALPSSTGREREQSFTKTVTACAELGLLATKTLTLESYGNLLVALAEEKGIAGPLGELQINPFMPDAMYSPSAYLQVLRCDFVFQNELCKTIDRETFSFRDLLVPRAEDLLRRVAAAIPANAANRTTTSWIRGEIESAKRLSKRSELTQQGKIGGAARPTLFRPLEDIFLTRLEFLVDFGVLRKPNPERYVYNTSPAFEKFRALLGRGSSMLTNDYFHFVAELSDRKIVAIRKAPDVVAHIRSGFERMRGLTGYAPILESLVYANMIRSHEDPWPITEIDDCHNALRESAGGARPTIRIIADRFRRPSEFTLAE
jgi:hypothetical protein